MDSFDPADTADLCDLYGEALKNAMKNMKKMKALPKKS